MQFQYLPVAGGHFLLKNFKFIIQHNSAEFTALALAPLMAHHLSGLSDPGQVVLAMAPMFVTGWGRGGRRLSELPTSETMERAFLSKREQAAVRYQYAWRRGEKVTRPAILK
jgi:hypothetical protein